MSIWGWQVPRTTSDDAVFFFDARNNTRRSLGASATNVANGKPTQEPAISPDGKLAVVQIKDTSQFNQQRYTLVDIASGQQLPYNLTGNQQNGGFSARFSADSRFLIDASQNTAKLIRLSDYTTQSFPFFSNAYGFSEGGFRAFSVSDDLSQIAFAGNLSAAIAPDDKNGAIDDVYVVKGLFASDQGKALTGTLSGNWYDPARSGEGFMIDIGTVGVRNVLFAAWFTHDNGKQRWIAGNGDFAEGARSVAMPLITLEGTGFGAQFNAAQLQNKAWGTATFRFDSCNQMRVTYEGGGEAETRTYQRLLRGGLVGATCQ